MVQTTKKLSILATFLFCALVFVACGDSGSSSVPDEFTDPIITPEEQGRDSIAEPDSASSDSATVDTTAEDSSDFRINMWGNGVLGSNLYLYYPADSFLARFEIGDIVTVEIVGYDTLDLPVVEYNSDVPIAHFMFSAVAGTDYVSLGIHNGPFSDVIGITDQTDMVEVNVSLKEKGGYLFGLDMRYVQYLDVYPEKYPELSVEEYANFREIRTTGMGEKKLYRSSSPIDDCLGRNLYVDSLAKEAGVATFINLTDTEDYAKTYKDFDSSYYATQNVIYLSLPVEFYSSTFKDGIVKGFRFMIEHEGPYLVHCIYGMDRTGFTLSVLEALMGAKTEEIQADYAKTFSNYFNVVDGQQVTLNEQQVNFFKAVVTRNLRAVYRADGIDIADADDIDWATPTERFLEKQGMTKEEISALKDRLK